MSRFDGWLVRYIVMHGTPAAMTIKKAAKGAGIRPGAFAQALHDPGLVRQDARHLGIDPEEMRVIDRWTKRDLAEEAVQRSMAASAAAVTPKRNSETRNNCRTLLGVTRPHRSRFDALGMPLNPIQHPEPQGEWHPGLDAAGPRK